MPDDKSVDPEKGSQKKMVPEADVIAQKKRAEKVEGELTEVKRQLADSQSEIGVLKDAIDEDGVTEVQKKLLEREKVANEREAELKKGEVTLKERQKVAVVTTLATQYGVEESRIRDAEDPEKEALKLQNERLTKEKESTESVFETGPAGSVKTQPKDMSDEVFDQFYETQKKAAQLKK